MLIQVASSSSLLYALLGRNVKDDVTAEGVRERTRTTLYGGRYVKVNGNSSAIDL